MLLLPKLNLYMETKYIIAIWKGKLKDLRIYPCTYLSKIYMVNMDNTLYTLFSNILHLLSFSITLFFSVQNLFPFFYFQEQL
jgi:hypothetical protein